MSLLNNKISKHISSVILAIFLLLGDISIVNNSINIDIHRAESFEYSKIPRVGRGNRPTRKTWNNYDTRARGSGDLKKKFISYFDNELYRVYAKIFPPWVTYDKLVLDKLPKLKPTDRTYEIANGYMDFKDDKFIEAEYYLSNAIFVNAQRLGYKPSSDPKKLAKEFLNKSESGMKKELNQIYKFIPRNLHVGAPDELRHKHGDKQDFTCGDSFFIYQSLGLLSFNFDKQNKSNLGNVMIDNNMYKFLEKKFRLPAKDPLLLYTKGRRGTYFRKIKNP